MTALNGHGVYAGPGGKGVTGAGRFAAWSGCPVTRLLDFTPTATYGHIAKPYALDAYIGMPYALELSVPMLPDNPTTSLEQVAAGERNDVWNTLAKGLTSRRLNGTTVRPGWEFNGKWYRWGTVHSGPEVHAEAFRQVATTMRAVPKQAFQFNWNPAVGPDLSDAVPAYPGDEYVDVIGLDFYDESWMYYPVKDPDDPALVNAARESVWRQLLLGPRGLQFWAGFARDHGKPLAVTEWGVTWDANTHGGGDNPLFVDRVVNWMCDPANGVVSSNYFETDRTGRAHALATPRTRFPLSAGRYLARARGIAGLGGGA